MYFTRMTAYDIEKKFKGFGITAEDIKKDFISVAAALKKQTGLQLRRIGNKYEYEIDDCRAKYFYQERTDSRRNIHIPEKMIGFDEYQFIVMLALFSCPNGYWRGSARQMLQYTGYKVKDKIGPKKIEEAIRILRNKKFIKVIDVTQNSYCKLDFLIMPGVLSEVKEVLLPFEIGRVCWKIVEGENFIQKRKVHLLKVWLAIENQEYEKKFYYYNICMKTGLSQNQVIGLYNILDESGLLIGLKKMANYFILSFKEDKKLKRMQVKLSEFR